MAADWVNRGTCQVPVLFRNTDYYHDVRLYELLKCADDVSRSQSLPKSRVYYYQKKNRCYLTTVACYMRFL
jgi:hypothetical protein